MHIYTAAVYTNNYMWGMNGYNQLNDVEKQMMHVLPHILESWHYVGKEIYVRHMRANKAKIFLDSGAFSAYTLGVTLSVKEYCNYIKQNSDIIRVEDGTTMASVLDGIGDVEQTYKNQLEMESLGVRPLPCFHAGEDEQYLEWYVANYDYITLGGMVGSSTQQLQIWLDRMWDRYLTDSAGNPKIKVHGFGITAVPLMERYPWYSCDSSSWIQAAAFGSIIMPGFDSGNLAKPLSVSDKSPDRYTVNQHITTLTDIEREVVEKHLADHGFTSERLATTYQSRAAFNLYAFGVINNIINQNLNGKYQNRVQELF